jgi:type I restriction enzyme, S subunit
VSGDTLPVNWEEWKLSDVGDWFGGGTPSKSEERFWNGSIPWVSPKDMKVTSILDAEDHISLDAVASSAAKIIPPGAVLFVTRSGILAHSFPVSTTRTNVTINQDLKAIVPFQPIDPEYLSWCLRAHARSILDRCTKDGTTVHSIEAPALKAYRVPIAPIEEQRRIVVKVEALFSELDKGVESLKTAREQLTVYRQAVLKQAFEGKLTDQWRRKNKDRLENPLKMLKRLRQEREACYRQQLSDWETAVMAWEVTNKDEKRPIKPKAPTPFQEPTPEELAELPDLPDGWIWARPEDIAAQEEYAIGIGPFGSNLKVSDYRENGIPLIFVRNITRSDFSRDLKYIDPKKYAELIAHSVKPLDLLITKMGDPPGDCEIYPETSPEAVLTADCLKFRLWEKYGHRKFYKNCFNSSLVRRQLGLITKGVAQKKISTARFKTILIPFLSIDEQQIIADHLDDVFSIVDQQEQAISESLQKAEALRQSILKKAFSGQLVTQNPEDEPASVLLERIRMEKANQAKTAKVSGKHQPRLKRVALT